MSTLLAPSFNELSPELFHVIVERLPLVYRAATTLSLALASRRLYEILCPELLYSSMHLGGEDIALKTLNSLIVKAKLVTEEDIRTHGNPSLSHCIHHLSLCTEIETPIRKHTSFDSLDILIEMNGLRHLQSLTLHPEARWDGTDDGSSRIKLPFLSSLRIGCPNLQRIQISGIYQTYQEEWIEPLIHSIDTLTSIHIEGVLLDYPTPTFDFSRLPTTNLHTLELRLKDTSRAQPIDVTGLLQCVIPNLRALILDHVRVSDIVSMNTFWRVHSGIERLELYQQVEGCWFNEMDDGILPNLKHLLCQCPSSPSVFASHTTHRLLIFFVLFVEAESFPPSGVWVFRLPLGIAQKPRDGHRWREDEKGEVSLADAKKPARRFDGDYIMSLAKAAPNLEELELMGTSDDTVESLTNSLLMFPKLARLTLSGGIHYQPFFPRSRNWEEYADFIAYSIDETKYGKYAPATFDEAVRDLANGCRALEVVTMGNKLHELNISIGASRRVVRVCDGDKVKELRKIKPWGSIIGREDEW